MLDVKSPRPERDTTKAVSQKNVEIVRANFEAWNAGDMDVWRELLDPDMIMRNPAGWPEPGGTTRRPSRS